MDVGFVFGQCGSDGTQPCDKTITKSKPKTDKSLSKPKQKTVINTKTTVTVNRSPLFNKLLGKWELLDVNIDSVQLFYSFLANGTGAVLNQKIPCASFTFVLKGDILQLKSKITHKCSNLEKEDVAETMTIKMKIEFDKNHRLGTTELMPDGSQKRTTQWATKAKK